MTTKNLATALIKFHDSGAAAKKGAANPFFKSKYASPLYNFGCLCCVQLYVCVLQFAAPFSFRLWPALRAHSARIAGPVGEPNCTK